MYVCVHLSQRDGELENGLLRGTPGTDPPAYIIALDGHMDAQRDAVADDGHVGTRSDDGTTGLPCRWIAAALSGQGPCSSDKGTVAGDAEASLWKKKWSGMRLVDTVVLDGSGDVENWVFTAKTGHIASKKRTQDRGKIAERFERFALANPRNTDGYVALASSCRGREPDDRVVLDKLAFQEAMAGSQVPPELLGATLQCYLRPQHGSNSFLRGDYRGRDHPCSLSKVVPLFRLPSSEAHAIGTESPRESPVLGEDPDIVRHRSEISRILSSLVAFLEERLPESKGHEIRTCDADFIVDDNGELWLTSLPRVSTAVTAHEDAAESIPPVPNSAPSSSPPGESAFLTKESQDSGDGGDTANPWSSHMPPLGIPSQQVAPLDGCGNPLGSARRLMPAFSDVQPTSSPMVVSPVHQSEGDKLLAEGALPAIPTMLGARSAAGDHNNNGVEQGQKRPIIERKNRIYVANVHAGALRGLCCWRQVSRRAAAYTMSSLV